MMDPLRRAWAFTGVKLARSVVPRCGLVAVMCAVACGNESKKDAGEQAAGGTAGGQARPVLSELPVDFRAQCPAGGCTLKLATTELSGIWSPCQNGALDAFDPSTFDFAAACAGAIKAYPILPRPPNGAVSVRFVNHGVAYEWEPDGSTCLVQSLLSTPGGKLLQPFCSSDVSRLTELDPNPAGPVLVNGADGNTYAYYGAPSAGETWIAIDLLVAADTPSLVTACTAAPVVTGRCEADGVTFPFGPNGVGPPPDARLARTWLVCLANDGSNEEIVQTCALGSSDYRRFRPDGSVDSFGVGGDNARCGQATVGATANELNFFSCDGDRIARGEIVAVTSPYELRTIDGNDYLIWYEPTHYGFKLDWVGMAEPDVTPDPCAAAGSFACVLNERNQ